MTNNDSFVHFSSNTIQVSWVPTYIKYKKQPKMFQLLRLALIQDFDGPRFPVFFYYFFSIFFFIRYVNLFFLDQYYFFSKYWSDAH